MSSVPTRRTALQHVFTFLLYHLPPIVMGEQHSILPTHRRILASFRNYLKNEHGLAGADAEDAFPLTVDDLRAYILFRSKFHVHKIVRWYLNGLSSHPKHGPKWERKVFRHKKITKLLEQLRERELENGSGNEVVESIDGDCMSVDYGLSHRIRPKTYLTARDSEEATENGWTCQIIEKGKVRGFRVTAQQCETRQPNNNFTIDMRKTAGRPSVRISLPTELDLDKCDASERFKPAKVLIKMHHVSSN